MAMSKRYPKSPRTEVPSGHSDSDGYAKAAKPQQFQKCKSLTIMGLFSVIALVLYVVHVNGIEDASLIFAGIPDSILSIVTSNTVDYELYPFLVDSEKVTTSVSEETGYPDSKILSKPTLPAFPVIDDLEDCVLEYKPADPPRKDASDWRPRFWIPSYPGSGSSNPTSKGDLLRDLISSLFGGEWGEQSGYGKAVKNFHMSIRNKLKRCKGMSETVGCSSGHPTVPTKPETQTDAFRKEVILPIRNPATVIPISYAYKNIQYHNAEKQVPEKEWKKMRDDYFEGSLGDWFNVIKFWRGMKKDSYYFTKLYVPFEDLVTTDAAKGAVMVKKLSDTISGRFSNSDGEHFFDTSTSERDYKCLWYRTAKNEWEREKTIIGDYIPPYTQDQKDKMVRDLRSFAVEIESDSFDGDQDAVLVSLLRRYADQIEKYVRVG